MENSDMEERRKLERFELSAPARIQVEMNGERPEELNLATRDVSSAGAFLYSDTQIPKGTNVRVEFYITMDTMRRIVGEKGKVKVKVKGKVIRVDADGIAIRFDSKYKITALENNNH